jgi:4-amino-4-deoxy-L-arabinose transferase-like glycosyltransferase
MNSATASDPEHGLARPRAGSRLRPWLLLPCVVGLGLALVIMSGSRPFGFAVPVAGFGLLLASAALVAALGGFDDREAPVATVELAALALPFAALAAALLAWVFAVRAAVVGALPAFLPSALLVPLLTLALGVAGTWLLCRLGALYLDEHGEPRALRRRHGAWLLVGLLLSYLTGLGRSSLIDPWETHYGEVAREILARNDWISFWWAQDGFFWSKPALSLWLEALSFSLFGLPYAPDGPLAAAAAGRLPEPEWAVRLPACALAVVAVYFCYRAVARGFGRRAGLLAGLALSTTPFWSLLAHQATTDMPYAAAVSCAVAFVALGLHSAPDVRVRSYRIRFGRRAVQLGAAQLLFTLIGLTSLSQIVYLISRHALFDAGGVSLHADAFWSGSGGGLCALGIPGNAPCQRLSPQHPALQPGFLAFVWGAALLALLVSQRGERRAQRLYFIAAWYAATLAFLAKGAPGLVLPIAITLGVLGISGRLRQLSRLELPAFGLLLACVALPWYAQAYARHGAAFFDRLFLHDMYNRAFVHVHDTNAGDDVSIGYYLRQLGYGLFPWTGLSVAGLLGAIGSTRSSPISAFLVTWFALSFGLFAAALTKYHHYILPAAVPAALLAGITLDRCFVRGERSADSQAERFPAWSSAAFGLAGLLAAAIVMLVARDLSAGVDGPARLLNLFTYNYARPWPGTLDFSQPLWLTGVLATCASALLLIARWRRLAAQLSAALACVFCLFLLGAYLPSAAPHWGQRELLLEYYARRSSARQPLVAFQMNWKGENFYSGNRVAVFVTSGDAFQVYLSKLRSSGARTLFVMTEHHRAGLLKSELGVVRRYQPLTDRELNNKFLLARVEL